jgi:hypothetical protein
VIGEPISNRKAVLIQSGILTEVDSYDWLTFLPMADGPGAYLRYFGGFSTGKMKILVLMVRTGALLSVV